IVTLLRALERHWFEPASLRDLAIVRIVIAGSALVLFRPDLDWMMMLAHAEPSTFRPLPILKLLMLPFGEWGVRPEPMFLRALWWLYLVAACGAVVGFATRLSLVALAWSATLIVAHNYSYGELHHPEAIFILAIWILACAPTGQALSLHALRRRIDRSLGAQRFEPIRPEDEQSELARWPLRVIQWLLVLAYLSAGLSKLWRGGLQWFNGYTLAYFLIQDGVRWGSAPALLLAPHPEVLALLSVGSIVIELTFALAVLVPRLAWPYVLAGTGLHIGIFVLQRATFFTFIVLYIVFIESLRRTWPRRLRAARPAPWTVIYDGLCPLCVRTMVVLDAFDLRRRLRAVDFERDWAAAAAAAPPLSPEQARAAIHLVGPDRRVYSGFAAFRVLTRLLPVLWPFLPLVYAPLSSTFGPRIYHLIATSRGRLSCRADTCTA
ncbi:MAG TPA: DCC1-like thiol-disulfide oxidoreductase family protein, partial [Gemmatimonadales bacterium]|nr:DCC1-like thiol-disulfide oxidoreductase family protein [Gemmatimonadales bacterium]